MNPRRVHDLMRAHFPARPASASEWAVVVDEQGLRRAVFKGLVRQCVGDGEVLVEANRKAGGLFPFAEALEFVATHAGMGRVLLTNREFTGFVVLESTGVASGWVVVR